MTSYLQTGENALYQGIYKNQVWYGQSTLVVKDSAVETALTVYPGMECVAPRGYVNGRQTWDRWRDYQTNRRDMQTYLWHTNRFLILLFPEKYYSINLIWNQAENQFLCYYVNFQLPYKRNNAKFQTLDLEIDLVIEPDFNWHWKDEEDYQAGVDLNIITKAWVQEIELAKREIFDTLERRAYPFDGAWLNWNPDPNWGLPTLPSNWDEV
ncbi:MAG: DUF402 domain-containing protein [Anaerolineales bacterium]|nr:DUF402 domain-containing protein [Anaerolineales bacterium]MCZ2123643.1 DUF402 domain-containing protein [Anaerolineales bacterium]